MRSCKEYACRIVNCVHLCIKLANSTLKRGKPSPGCCLLSFPVSCQAVLHTLHIVFLVRFSLKLKPTNQLLDKFRMCLYFPELLIYLIL